jgi:hypothetical protein
MSKCNIELYNISSDTDSTACLEDTETSGDEDYIIKDNKTAVFLNYSLELEQFYFNNLVVNNNLIIPICLNVPRVLI